MAKKVGELGRRAKAEGEDEDTKLRVEYRELEKLLRCLTESNESVRELGGDAGNGANRAASENKAGIRDARAVREEMEETR